jgi:hypothetical protein
VSLRPLGCFLAFDLVLNFAWEMAQMPLYATRMTTERCLVAAGGDVVLTVAALALAGVLARRRRSVFWAVLVLLLAAVPVSIEVLALSAGRWSYAVAMPTLEGVGLAPLVQLPLIGVVSAWLAGRARVSKAAARTL